MDMVVIGFMKLSIKIIRDHSNKLKENKFVSQQKVRLEII